METNYKFSETEFIELTPEEILETNGGESAWYWLSYGIGSVGRGVAYVWNECARDQAGYAQVMM